MYATIVGLHILFFQLFDDWKYLTVVETSNVLMQHVVQTLPLRAHIGTPPLFRN
jgi:hypothetical protein